MDRFQDIGSVGVAFLYKGLEECQLGAFRHAGNFAQGCLCLPLAGAGMQRIGDLMDLLKQVLDFGIVFLRNGEIDSFFSGHGSSSSGLLSTLPRSSLRVLYCCCRLYHEAEEESR